MPSDERAEPRAMTGEQIARMVRDAEFVGPDHHYAPQLFNDLCCHVRALAAEVERLAAHLKESLSQHYDQREKMADGYDAEIKRLRAELDRLTTELAAVKLAVSGAVGSPFGGIVDTVKWIAGERDQARAEAAMMRGACIECLKAIDDCCASTGHFRVAKTSEQRLAIEAAIKGTAGAGLLTELAAARAEGARLRGMLLDSDCVIRGLVNYVPQAHGDKDWAEQQIEKNRAAWTEPADPPRSTP